MNARPVTMSVRVAEFIDGLGYVREVTIEATCPRCGGPRGWPKTQMMSMGRSGRDRREVDCWSNPCGHVDAFDLVLAEAEFGRAVLVEAGVLPQLPQPQEALCPS